MDKFWAWWALIFYILPVVIVIPLVRRRRRVVNSLLTGVALRYNGTIKSMIGIPYYVGFDLEGVPVSLSLSHGSKNSPPQTLMTAEPALPVGTVISVAPEGTLAAFAKRWGLKDIEVMDPEFDRQFIIHGSDENLPRRFLQPDIRQVLLKWRDRDVSLRVTDGRMRFAIARLIEEDHDLDEFIQDGAALLSGLRALC